MGWIAGLQAGHPAAEAEELFRQKGVFFERLRMPVASSGPATRPTKGDLSASIDLADPNASWYVNCQLRVRVNVDADDRITSVETHRFNYGL